MANKLDAALRAVKFATNKEVSQRLLNSLVSIPGVFRPITHLIKLEEGLDTWELTISGKAEDRHLLAEHCLKNISGNMRSLYGVEEYEYSLIDVWQETVDKPGTCRYTYQVKDKVKDEVKNVEDLFALACDAHANRHDAWKPIKELFNSAGWHDLEGIDEMIYLLQTYRRASALAFQRSDTYRESKKVG